MEDLFSTGRVGVLVRRMVVVSGTLGSRPSSSMSSIFSVLE